MVIFIYSIQRDWSDNNLDKNSKGRTTLSNHRNRPGIHTINNGGGLRNCGKNLYF